MIATLHVHRRPVHLPARSEVWRAGLHSAADRRCLSGLRPMRMTVGPVIAARRAASVRTVVRPAPVAPVAEYHDRPRQWPWTLATLAILVLIVACCGAAL